MFATLVRLLGDFDLAEEAMSEAFRAALEQWPAEGVPQNPRAWLVSAGRFKAIDKIRRKARFERVAAELALAEEAEMPAEPDPIADDQLRLIFTCCHPELSPDAQVALTLRETCGLLTEEIATAFLTMSGSPASLGARAACAGTSPRYAPTAGSWRTAPATPGPERSSAPSPPPPR